MPPAVGACYQAVSTRGSPASGQATHMHDAGFISDLAIVLSFAAATGVLARKLGQSSILGYLFAGLLVGPYLPVPILSERERVETMAEFGVVLVMFAIGLEFRLAKLLRVLPSSGFTGLVQVSSMMAAGLFTAHLLGWSDVEAAFLGASLAISSTMVVSKVFEQTPVEPATRQVVLGVLVLQDVVAIALITAMTALAAGGGLSAGALGATVGRLGAALIAMVGLGLLVVPRLMRTVLSWRSPEHTAVVAMGVCFAVALLAERLGYSVALGAFVAGVLVAESGRGEQVEHLVQPMRDVFAAVFFVSIGMTVDPVQAWVQLPVSLLVFAVVVVGQLVSVSVAALLSGNGLRRALTAGMALGQIGEFSFILAAIGVGAGVVRGALSTILVTVAVLTAFTTPWLLSRAERIVAAADRLLPERLQHLLSLYEEWFERLSEASGWFQAHPVRRALRAIALDAMALLLVLLLATFWMDDIARPLQRSLGLDIGVALGLCGLGLALLSVPFWVAMARATRSLSHAVVEAVTGPAGAEEGRATRIARRALGLAVRLSVLAGVGVPLGLGVELLVGDIAALAWFSGIAVATVVGVWRTAAAVNEAFLSGAESIAAALEARETSPNDDTMRDANLIPGLDSVTALTLSVGCDAVGRTLAQLDLRARTGATVIAIHRADGQVVLPHGNEALRSDDRLAITGAAAALAGARTLLVEGRVSVVPEPDGDGVASEAQTGA